MKIQNILMTFAISSALTCAVSSCQQTPQENPLLQESTLPYGAPDFSKIKTSDYLPAFENSARCLTATEQPLKSCRTIACSTIV